MKNPYKPQSLRWKLVEGDWEDLTPSQIAEVLDCTPQAVHKALRVIEEGGIEVPYVKGRPGRPRKDFESVN